MAGPAFTTFTPNVLNDGTSLTIAMPVGNTGTGTAGAVWLTQGTLGSAQRITPALFRVFKGNLAMGNNLMANAVFAAPGLTVGSKYLLRFGGTYAWNSATYGFSVNRFILIPPVVANPIASLSANLTVSLGTDSWAYTINNTEDASLGLYINALSIDISAPVTVTGTPHGWTALTDNSTYVGWYANDSGPTYPDYVAPGGSRSGFQIQSAESLSQSTVFVLTSWDKNTDAAGLVASGLIATPSQT